MVVLQPWEVCWNILLCYAQTCMSHLVTYLFLGSVFAGSNEKQPQRRSHRSCLAVTVWVSLFVSMLLLMTSEGEAAPPPRPQSSQLPPLHPHDTPWQQQQILQQPGKKKIDSTLSRKSKPREKISKIFVIVGFLRYKRSLWFISCKRQQQRRQIFLEIARKRGTWRIVWQPKKISNGLLCLELVKMLFRKVRVFVWVQLIRSESNIIIAFII